MFTIKEILESTGGRLVKGNLSQKVCGVSIDSRSIRPGELFVAIKGKNFDGHSFIAQAADKGAVGILFSNSYYQKKLSFAKRADTIAIVKVNNTLQALITLAHRHRTKFEIPVIAITGSNGKTTTKEMLSTILGQRFNVLRNPGTENSFIGVSLTMLKLRRRHDIAVIEIGANHRGEIGKLSWIIQPSLGIITNIGPSHLKLFKTLKGVLQAKLELIKHLAKEGELIINKDDRLLAQLNGRNLRTVTFGFDRSCDFWAETVEHSEKDISFLLNKKHKIVLRTLGVHNIYNALASVACARCLGISFNEIKNVLAFFEAPAMRMQMLNINNIKIINDCYNSNPKSFQCALDFLNRCTTGGKKIVVCGDMLELGKQAKKLHANIGKRVARGKIDFLITAGPLAKHIASGALLSGMSKRLIRRCRDSLEAGRYLSRVSHPEDIVLLKGSRGMKMEKAIECFMNCSTH